ncbi:MAG TPA: gfo/Idh/MocA family oxidoreductase, partial [Candidatus Angelobacter sp.]|nr:gfo/Idh/MocA family oxidoreductase [Candidatus Angelobacter sp.]
MRRHDTPEWLEVPLIQGFTENSRGLGLVDMIYAIQQEQEHRANGRLAYHVLDIMHGFHEASKNGAHYTLTSQCKRPDVLPVGINQTNLEVLLGSR